MKTKRRSALKKMFASVAGLAGLGITAKASEEKTVDEVINFQNAPTLSNSTRYGNLLFLSGRGGYGGEPFTIENHTKITLDLLEESLIRLGSSMEKCLKATVYLTNIADLDGMNATYRGRFGANPPARSTVSVTGMPGNSLVQIDVIAYI